MFETSFNDGWVARPKTSIFAQLRAGAESEVTVTLPHDAILAGERSPAGAGAQAFFPGGTFEYLKQFDAPETWRDKRVALHFHGVYRDAMVFVNDAFVAQ